MKTAETAKLPGQRPLTNEELDILQRIDGQPDGTAYGVSGCFPRGVAPRIMYADALALLMASAHVVEVAFTPEKGAHVLYHGQGPPRPDRQLAIARGVTEGQAP